MTGCNKIKTEYEIRNSDNKIVTLETNYGKLVLELYHDVAPAHADSFAARSAEGFYDGTVFHRIIAGFMAQGGDPTGTGAGDAGYRLNAEFSDLPHVRGTLSAARSMDPNSASCQFFVCFGDAPHLNGQYTIFGHLINGYDALQTIENVETVQPPGGREKSKPVEEVKLIKAYLSDAAGEPLEK